MIVKFKRSGKGLSPPEFIDIDPLHTNTVLVHEITARVTLYENEQVWVTFGTPSDVPGKFTPLTQPIATRTSYYSDNKGTQRRQFSVTVPNLITRQQGNYVASIGILAPYTGETPTGEVDGFRQFTSGIVEFSVNPSVAGLDFETIDPTNAMILQYGYLYLALRKKLRFSLFGKCRIFLVNFGSFLPLRRSDATLRGQKTTEIASKILRHFHEKG